MLDNIARAKQLYNNYEPSKQQRGGQNLSGNIIVTFDGSQISFISNPSYFIYKGKKNKANFLELIDLTYITLIHFSSGE